MYSSSESSKFIKFIIGILKLPIAKLKIKQKTNKIRKENNIIFCLTLINFTKSIAKEYSPKVLVNSVSPGAILWDVNEPSDEKKNNILKSIPLKRIGNEKDIVSIIDFLITKNTYMTGRNINIDGGRSLE